MSEETPDTDRMDSVYLDWNMHAARQDRIARENRRAMFKELDKRIEALGTMRMEMLFGTDPSSPPPEGLSNSDLEPTDALTPIAEQHYLMSISILEQALRSLKIARLEMRREGQK